MTDSTKKELPESKKKKKRAQHQIAYLKAEGLSTTEIVSFIMETEGVVDRTVYRWIKDVEKNKIPAIVPALDHKNFGTMRWDEANSIKKRQVRYRQLADQYRTEGDRAFFSAERLAIQLTDQLIKLFHWGTIPPERFMSDPDMRALAINEMLRGLTFMTDSELFKLLESINIERQARRTIQETNDSKKKEKFENIKNDLKDLI